jgi:hypothetical protein
LEFVNNEPEQIEIRKSQNTLIVVGSGIVLFSIWSMVKMMGLLVLLKKETVNELIEKVGTIEGVSEDTLFWIFFAIILFFMAFALAIRVFVGLSAVAEGRGKRRGLLYILIAVIMMIGDICFFCVGFFMTEEEQFGALARDQSISTLIIDVTSLIMLTQMVISALRIRKFTRRKRRAKD